jgi:hypothetical protein
MSAQGVPASADYRDRCFLCLRSLRGSVKRTREHVVPEWLIRLCDLSATQSVLPSGQTFKYWQRTVPCCEDCNGFLSAGLEHTVSEAFRQGFNAVRALPEPTLLLWLGKVYYGTRWRELSLRIDVADPASPLMLVEEELLGAVDYLRQLLLSGPDVQWAAPPGSLFLYRCGVPDEVAHRFDFFVPTFGTDFIALRINDVFVMAVFGDNGHWERTLAGTHGQLACDAVVMHPAQCTEAMLRLYSHTLRYQSSGCFDVIETGDGDRGRPGGVDRLFLPSFVIEPSGIPAEQLDRAFTATFMKQAFGYAPPASLLDDASRGRLPTCLYDPTSGQPAQADCYEPRCSAVRARAGWATDPWEPACPRCGARAG